METTVIATKGDKRVEFIQSETHTSIKGKNVNVHDIQILMDNDVHNGAEFDGWNVNFD
jgi:hypothetical protein